MPIGSNIHVPTSVYMKGTLLGLPFRSLGGGTYDPLINLGATVLWDGTNNGITPVAKARVTGGADLFLNGTPEVWFPLGSKDWSIAGWFNPTSVTGQQIICSIYTTTGNERIFAFDINGTSCRFLYGSDTGVFEGTLTVPTLVVAVNTWYHYAIRYNATTRLLEVRINDSDTFETSVTKATQFKSTVSNADFRVSTWISGANGFSGRHAALGVWDKVLSDSEVTALYNGGTAVPYPLIDSSISATLLGFWDFDEWNAGDNAVDKTGNGITLTQSSNPAIYNEGPGYTNGRFSTFTDQIGTNNLTQATDSRKPVLYTEKFLLFEPTPDINMSGDVDSLDNFFQSGGTVIAVILPNSNGDTGGGRVFDKTFSALYMGGVSGGFSRLVYFHAFSTNSGIWTMTTYPMPTSEFSIVTFDYDASNVANDPNVRVNGSVVTWTEGSTPAGSHLDDSGSPMFIGNRSALNRGFDGCLLFYVWFPEVLTNDEKALAESFVNSYLNLGVL